MPMVYVETYTSTTTVAAALAGSKGSGGIKVNSVEVKFSAAPTTSEDLTLDIDSGSGATYDTNLRTVDPSEDSNTSIVWEGPFYVDKNDALDVNYANTDTRTVTVQYHWEEALA